MKIYTFNQFVTKSFKLFSNSPDDVDYLIICNPNFQKKSKQYLII